MTRDEFAALDLPALREPSYVFRIERTAMDVEAALSFYIHLPSLSSACVTADGDGYQLLEQPVADVIYAGLVEALGLWPGTHPELDDDAPAPDPEAAIETTLVVLRPTEDGIEEHELTWLDAGDDGVWLVGDDGFEPTSDLALYQAIPLMLRFADR